MGRKTERIRGRRRRRGRRRIRKWCLFVVLSLCERREGGERRRTRGRGRGVKRGGEEGGGRRGHGTVCEEGGSLLFLFVGISDRAVGREGGEINE